MPGWTDLNRMINEARQARDAPAPPTQGDQVRLMAGLFNFFQPVYEVMDMLHTAEIRLRGDSSMSRIVQSGTAFKELAQARGASPYIQLPLDANTALTITVAIRRGLAYPEIIERAKWRCRVMSNGDEIETRLVDNRDDLARWMINTIMQYEIATPEPAHRPADPPGPRTETQEAEEWIAPPTREHRVIMLDDDLNEETR